MKTTSNELLAAALKYAQRGWHVFPCQPRSKRPLTKHGLKDATTDVTTIAQWWQQFPAANIGIATGRSSLAVIDLDGEEGFRSWLELCEEHNLPTDVPEVITGKGVHLYFTTRDGARPATRIAAGVDIRAGESYVIAPPSVHENGKRYQWREGKSPDDLPLVPLPDVFVKPPEKVRVSGRIIPQGERNNTLFWLGCSLRAKGMSDAAIKEVLHQENKTRCTPPLDSREVDHIVASACRYEPGRIDLNLTADLGHAKTLQKVWQGRYRFAFHRGKWLRFVNGVWQVAEDETVMADAAATLRQIYADEIRNSTDKRCIDELARRCRETCVTAKMESALKFLKGLRNMSARAEEWDSDPWLLNCRNGTLELRTMAFRDHDPDDLLTKQAGVEYHSTATSLEWHEHLATCLPNPDLQRQVQRDIGKALLGIQRDHSLPVWYGRGANGKSTTALVLQNVLGSYAKKAAPDLLMDSKYEQHPTRIADLQGARLVFSIEVEEGKRLAEALVKELTGGDTIKARFMRQDFFEFRPSFRLVLIVNHKPVIVGADTAIWRRIRLVPWDIEIPEHEQKPQDELVERLTTPAVLNWLLAGFKDWTDNPHWTAEAVRAATESYREESDLLGGFLQDCCETGSPRYSISAAALYAAYAQWCEENGNQAVPKQRFGRYLQQRGFASQRDMNRRFWVGVRLKPNAS